MKDDSPFSDSYHILSLPAIEGRSPHEQDTINSVELCKLTGATYRQIDYWCSLKYISPVENNNPGSGKPRRFNKTSVDKIKLLVKISKAFARENSPLQKVVDHYEEGMVDMGDGIFLTWDVIELEREV